MDCLIFQNFCHVKFWTLFWNSVSSGSVSWPLLPLGNWWWAGVCLHLPPHPLFLDLPHSVEPYHWFGAPWRVNGKGYGFYTSDPSVFCHTWSKSTNTLGIFLGNMGSFTLSTLLILVTRFLNGIYYCEQLWFLTTKTICLLIKFYWPFMYFTLSRIFSYSKFTLDPLTNFST